MNRARQALLRSIESSPESTTSTTSSRASSDIETTPPKTTEAINKFETKPKTIDYKRFENPDGPEPKPIHYEYQENLDEWDNWDPMAEDYESGKNTLALNPDRDPLCTITGQGRSIDSKVGKTTICERFAKYGECADGEFCAFLHVDPSLRDKIWTIQNTIESNKNRAIMNYTYLSPLELKPDSKARLLASVTNAISPANFYIILPYDTMNFAPLSKDEFKIFVDRVHTTSSGRLKLQKCHEQLSAIFGHSYRIDNVNDDIYPSQIVACQLKDGRFRRAMVVSLPDVDDYNYKLFLLDTGTEVQLPRELIYDIKAHCLSEPPMAVNCRLDIKPAKGAISWSDEALQYFVHLAREKAQYLYCAILDYIKVDRIFTVDLYDAESGASVTDSMIDKGLAHRCEF